MVSHIAGFQPIEIRCTHCNHSHLDKDWFAVHPHQTHLCAGCGKHFRDLRRAIGNPVSTISGSVGRRSSQSAERAVEFRQTDYPGGIQIWGSNPAIFWTNPISEESGIHVHAYDEFGSRMLDDTYSQVTIDDVTLDADMVRLRMAQSALPHLAHRITDLRCSACGASHFDSGENGFTPRTNHTCLECAHPLKAVGRLKKVIGNPIVAALEQLGNAAVRTPQLHESGLLIEAP